MGGACGADLSESQAVSALSVPPAVHGDPLPDSAAATDALSTLRFGSGGHTVKGGLRGPGLRRGTGRRQAEGLAGPRGWAYGLEPGGGTLRALRARGRTH